MVASESPQTAGTISKQFTLDADNLLFSLWVSSISGTLLVEILTLTEEGKEVLVTSFPIVSAPTPSLLREKAADILSIVRVRITYTGACTYEIRARGISSTQSSVRLVGSSSGTAYQVTVSTDAQTLLIPSTTDRQSVTILNNNQTTGILYLGFTEEEASPADGFPLRPLQPMSIDLSAGATVWAVGTEDIDVRIIEAGA
jgi:hypothetical protein